MKLFIITLLTFLLFACTHQKNNDVTNLNSTEFKQHSYRALNVISEKSVLLSGTNGRVFLVNPTTLESINISPSDTSKIDFRAAAVLNDSTFLVASAGSPGFILRTNSQGKTWDTTWVNNAPDVFIDGMQFSDAKTGWAYGDIQNGYLLVLKTTDGGITWQRIKQEALPNSLESEGSFAASNSGIAVTGDTILLAYSNPKSNRIVASYNAGVSWKSIPTKMRTGEAMGTFALDFSRNGLALVGGSFIDSTSAQGTGNFFKKLSDTCFVSTSTPTAYCSGLSCIGDTCIAVGRSGTMLSKDGGNTWQKINDDAFYTSKAFKESFYLTGKKGKFKVLSLAKLNETY